MILASRRWCLPAVVVGLFTLVGFTPSGCPDPAIAQVVTPPGPAQFITPPEPIVVQPTPTPAVIPTPDNLKTFEIVATINGKEVTEPVISTQVGKLVTLTLRGVAGTEEQAKRAAEWCIHRATDDVSIREAGHYVTFTAPSDKQGAYLFVACMNSLEPLEKPLVASRWVVVGTLPQPPPIPPVPVDPDPPVPPEPQPVKPTSLRVMILRDLSAERDLPRPQLAALQSNDLEGWLTTVCSKDAEGTPLWRKWDDGYADESVTDKGWLPAYKKAIADSNGKRPWLGIWDGERNTVSVEFPADEAAAKALIQKHVP